MDDEIFRQRAVDLVHWELEWASPETIFPMSTPETFAPMMGVSFSTPMVS
jgi:hypothetical protein